MAQKSHQWLIPGGVSSAFTRPGGRGDDGEAVIKVTKVTENKTGSMLMSLQNNG